MLPDDGGVRIGLVRSETAVDFWLGSRACKSQAAVGCVAHDAQSVQVRDIMCVRDKAKNAIPSFGKSR